MVICMRSAKSSTRPSGANFVDPLRIRRDGLYAHMKQGKTIAEKYLFRNFLTIQRSLETAELGNAYWLPALANKAIRFPLYAYWNRRPLDRESFDHYAACYPKREKGSFFHFTRPPRFHLAVLHINASP